MGIISRRELNLPLKQELDNLNNNKADKDNTYSKLETDTRIQSIINSAPGALDTLKELATALGDDPNFATSVTTRLGNKVDKITGKQLSTEDYSTIEKTNAATAFANNHTHTNKSILDTIVQAVIDKWNAAYTHISDIVAHITSAERNLWNTVSNKMDKSVYDSNGDGIVDSTSKLATPRTISLNGDATGSVSFDGSVNSPITVTIADNSHNHTIANITNLQSSLDTKAPLVSPSLTGTPTAPTATSGANTTQLATTAFVSTAISSLVNSAPDTLDTLNELATALGNDPNFATSISNTIGTKAPLISPTFTGTPKAPTAISGTNNTQIATTAFVSNSIFGLVNSAPGVLDTLNELATALGNDPNFATTMTTLLSTKAPVASPTFTGIPKAPTATTGNNTTQLATTAFVTTAVTNVAAGAVTSANKLTTSRNISLSGDVTGSISFDGSTNVIIASTVVDDSHDHTISTITNLQTSLDAKAPLSSPIFIGIPVAPTATLGTNTTQLATTAFVTTAVSGITSVTGTAGSATKLTTARTVSLTGDVSGSGSFDGSANLSITAIIADNSHNHSISTITNLQTILDAKASINSPIFTGIPTAATAVNGTNTTQLATTAFVNSAISNATSASSISADKLTTPRTISLTGDVIGSVAFDGSTNVSIVTTAKPTGMDWSELEAEYTWNVLEGV